jgi:hypothetical protein
MVGKTDFELDKDTLKRIQDVSALPTEEKKQVFMVIAHKRLETDKKRP